MATATAVANGVIPTANAASKGEAATTASAWPVMPPVSPARRRLRQGCLGAAYRAGKDTLYTHAIKGFQGKAGMMPAKGGNAAMPDARRQGGGRLHGVEEPVSPGRSGQKSGR